MLGWPDIRRIDYTDRTDGGLECELGLMHQGGN